MMITKENADRWSGRRGQQKFAVELASALLEAGVPAHRLEEAMEAFAQRVGMQAHFFAAPSAVMASFGAGKKTWMVRGAAGELNLGRLESVDRIAEGVAAGTLGVREARKALKVARRQPDRWSPAAMAWAWTVTSSTSAVFFGGGPREIVVAGWIGLGCFGIQRLLGADVSRQRLWAMLCSFMAMMVVAAVAAHVPLRRDVTLLAGLVILLPGLSFTTAMIELSTGHALSGAGRLLGSMRSLLELGFGVAVAAGITRGWVSHEAVVAPLPWWVALAVTPLMALGLVVVFQARFRRFPLILAAALTAVTCSLALSGVVESWLAGAIAAVAVTVLSHALSRRLDLPVAMMLVPGILLLVPGSLGFRSVTALIEMAPNEGVQIAFQMALSGVALATGVLAGTAIAPPRRAL